jgi:hypothetical protein
VKLLNWFYTVRGRFNRGSSLGPGESSAIIVHEKRLSRLGPNEEGRGSRNPVLVVSGSMPPNVRSCKKSQKPKPHSQEWDLCNTEPTASCFSLGIPLSQPSVELLFVYAAGCLTQ